MDFIDLFLNSIDTLTEYAIAIGVSTDSAGIDTLAPCCSIDVGLTSVSMLLVMELLTSVD